MFVLFEKSKILRKKYRIRVKKKIKIRKIITKIIQFSYKYLFFEKYC